MRIYLTQHGLAIPKEIDPQRPLSEQGVDDVRRLAEFLRRAGLQVGRVLHSGKLRAEQTALLLADALGSADRPDGRSGLAPNDPVEPLAKELDVWSEDTLLVGHLPYLGRLASLLLGSGADRPVLAFHPGSMACLERDEDGRWSLAWMIRPEILGPTGD